MDERTLENLHQLFKTQKTKKNRKTKKSVPDYDNELYSHQPQEHHQLAMALQVACKHRAEDSDMIQNAL